MHLFLVTLTTVFLTSAVQANSWPYDRCVGHQKLSGHYVPNKRAPEFSEDPDNLFVDWLRSIVNNSPPESPLSKSFSNGTISPKAKSINDLLDEFDIPTFENRSGDAIIPPSLSAPSLEAPELFSHLGYPVDAGCIADKSKWWYRTYDGSCNWLRKDETNEGAVGMPKARDYNQHYYADGISKPREGPNARAVSNAFFKRKERLYYEHTPLLVGLIEFIMHDVTYSKDSKSEFIDVPMPADEEEYPMNTTLRVWRTEAAPGTGTSKDNPRENVNMATTWLDISSLYGSGPEVAAKLRSFKGGELLTQEVKSRGNKGAASYLPYNTMGVPANTRPGVPASDLFAGGDARTNEDWMMLGVHTLMLREHNRLCKILAKQHPEYDDEQIYQTIRLVLSAKYALIANSYQMAYWTDQMPWPRDDGFPLYRQMYGENALQINPANTYPWPLVTKAGKPMVVSAEMAVVYRFHEFIIPDFPIVDASNKTLWQQDLFATGFNSSGFVDAGLENVLRGMVGSTIPNFKSGVDDAFRTAGKYRGRPFDIATWSVIHEREQGLPTFNKYFAAYNKQDPKVVVPIRKRFEDFSTNPEMVTNLKKLYATPDDVDLVVGIQLEEEMFPGTTVPKSALIISLFSLFGMGNSDRFSVGFAMMRCLLVDKPWDCHPSNALEELLWPKIEVQGFPNFRFYDTFWLTELDFQAHGTNLLWRLITENSEIKCVQHHPLFPANPTTNPVLCTLPKEKPDPIVLLLTALQVLRALILQNKSEAYSIAAALLALIVWLTNHSKNKVKSPPVLQGWPILGEALTFQKNPLQILNKGFQKYGNSASKSFGIKLASLTHFVITDPRDLDIIKADDPYEAKFSLHAFLGAINFPIITKKENFDSDLHTTIIRTHFSDPKTVASFGPVIEEAARAFIQRNPLVPSGQNEGKFDSLNDWCSRYITFVTSRCIVGPQGFDSPELLQTFMKFNDDAIKAMGLSALLPSFLQFLAASDINKDFDVIRKTLAPIIKKRRDRQQQTTQPVFLDYIIEVVDDDSRVSDLVALVVWGGLINLQSTFTSTLLDILNEPGLQNTILSSLAGANSGNLNTFGPSSPQWKGLRSAMFESIRLSGPVTGPARSIVSEVRFASDPSLVMPKGKIATLSAYYTHRQSNAWGPSAKAYVARRFLDQEPPIGEPNYVTWGLKGPHTCPGRWFAQEAICLMVQAVLQEYEIQMDKKLEDDEKYVYTAGNVDRTKVGGTVWRRV